MSSARTTTTTISPGLIVVPNETSNGAKIYVDNSTASKVVNLLQSPKFVSDAAGMVKPLVNNDGIETLNSEYGHVATLLSPMALLQMTYDAIKDCWHPDQKLGVVNVKFKFDFIKTICDTFQAVVLLTSSIALEVLARPVAKVKHLVSLIKDFYELCIVGGKISESPKLNMEKNIVSVVKNINDSLFRVIKLGLLEVCFCVGSIISWVGFIFFLVEKLYFESKDVSVNKAAATALGLQVYSLSSGKALEV